MRPCVMLVHVPTRSAFGRRQERSGAGGASRAQRVSEHAAMGRASRSVSIQEVGSPNRGKQTVAPTNNRKSVERYTAFMVMAVVTTAGFLLMAGLWQLADRRAAQTGDFIAFPATRVPSLSTASFAARRAIVA